MFCRYGANKNLLVKPLVLSGKSPATTSSLQTKRYIRGALCSPLSASSLPGFPLTSALHHGELCRQRGTLHLRHCKFFSIFYFSKNRLSSFELRNYFNL